MGGWIDWARVAWRTSPTTAATGRSSTSGHRGASPAGPRPPCWSASGAITVIRGRSCSASTSTTASLADIEDEVMCPVCGTLLELSDSPQAQRERAYINTLIAQGKTKQQIEDALVEQYGPNVLATPSGSGFDLTAWIVPGLA